MAFHVFDNNEEGAAFVVSVIAIPICFFATLLRFVSTVRSARTIGAEDWFALVALLTFLVYTSIDLWILRTMNGKSVFQLGALPIPTVIEIYRVGYVMNIQTPLNQTFAKLSLLTFYHRIFSINRSFVRWVFSIAIIQIMWCIAMVLVRLFQCKPIAAAYNPTIKGTCLNSQILLAAGDSINSAIDFVMVGMAVWMVVQLKMSMASKLKLSILFALGGFSGIIGIIKISEAYGNVGNNIRDATWNIVQQATSILCCCAPIYKSILQELNIIHKLGLSFLYGSGSRTRKSQYANKSSEATSASDSRGKSKNWLPLDGSSQREVAWTEVNSSPNKMPSSYAMKTVVVNQSIERV